jgi:hypothetical protein
MAVWFVPLFAKIGRFDIDTRFVALGRSTCDDEVDLFLLGGLCVLGSGACFHRTSIR